MFLFIMIIARCFQGVGRSVRAMEDVEPRRDQLCVWAMGAALFAHVVSYMSTSYFDQNIVNWYLLMAMISTLTDRFGLVRRREYAQVEQIETDAESSYEPHPVF